jgi:integrase
MAYIDKRRRKNGTISYLVRWSEPSGKVVSKSFRTLDEARRLRAEMEDAINRGQYVPQETRKLPFGRYAKQVLDADRLARATRLNYDTCLGLQLKPLEHLPIETIDPGLVRTLFGQLREQGASDHTLHMTKKVLSKVCGAAVEDGILTRNPARAVKLSKPARRQTSPLTPEEVENVAGAVRRRWRAAVLLGAWGGLRVGEVGALNVEDIDWERGSVRISKSMGRFGLKETKTASSNRVVVLPRQVMKELAAHVLEFQGPNGELFVTEKRHERFNSNVATKVMRGTGVKFHDLRHTAVAILIKKGAHPRAIMERMGHSSITVTMDQYGHLFPGAHDSLARTLEETYVPILEDSIHHLGGGSV